MSNYWANFNAMLARFREHEAGQRRLLTQNNQVGGQVSTRSRPAPTTASPEPENIVEEPNENTVLNTDKENTEPPRKKFKKNENMKSVLFNSETLIAENDSLEAFVVKSYLKRQVRFR